MIGETRRLRVRLLSVFVILALVLVLGVGCGDDDTPAQTDGAEPVDTGTAVGVDPDAGGEVTDHLSVRGLVERWQFDVGTGATVAPVVLEDAVVAATADGRLVVLDAVDGEPRGAVSMAAPIVGLVGTGEGRVMVATTVGLTFYDVKALAAVWRKSMSGIAGIAVVDRLCVVTTVGGSVWTLDAVTGDTPLEIRSETPTALPPVPIGPNVAVAGTDGGFSSIDPKDGDVRLLFELSSPAMRFTVDMSAGPTGDGVARLIVLDQDGRLYQFAADGNERAQPARFPHAIIADGVGLHIDRRRVVGFTLIDGEDTDASFVIDAPGAPPLSVGVGPAGVAIGAIDGVVSLFEVTYE